MKDNKVNYIIPRIYNLRDVYFVQWLGREYYIEKIKNIVAKKSVIYFLFDYVLMILIWLIAGLIPIKSPYDVIKMFLLVVITGIQIGIGITIVSEWEDKNK